MNYIRDIMILENLLTTIDNIANILLFNKYLFIVGYLLYLFKYGITENKLVLFLNLVFIFCLFIIYIMYNISAYHYVLNYRLNTMYSEGQEYIKLYNKKKIKEKIKEKTFLNNDDCPICLDKLNLNNNNKVYYICNNNHYFHLKCLEKWLDNKHICPICRELLEYI
jgi:hypothetical protein